LQLALSPHFLKEYMNQKTPLTALQVMQDAPVIPVIVLNDVAHAVPLARAMLAGGIRMLEVTLRTPQALECIEAIAREVPDAVVGAGTVRSKADAQAAVNAGARFAVSPGYTSAVGQACRDVGLALLPGVATGGEIMAACEDGFTELKFFPAVQAGGVAMLKAWGGPFFDVKFCPTGGITLQNAPDFLNLSNVVCVGGSWLIPAQVADQGDWTRVTRLAEETRHLRKNKP
jgi:2-dehydro-3-deoxyphosphogluconate aldolase/(4S)-4-hydroxy-2-oxoglutarate aldolase